MSLNIGKGEEAHTLQKTPLIIYIIYKLYIIYIFLIFRRECDGFTPGKSLTYHYKNYIMDRIFMFKISKKTAAKCLKRDTNIYLPGGQKSN